MSVAEAAAIGSTAWYDGLRTRSAAALQRVREAAYGAGGYVGQDGFMTADQIVALAHETGVAAGARVLDVCCGSGGPALELVRRTGCRIVGVDLSREGLRRARSLARTRGIESSAAFVIGVADRLPCTGPFDAVMLLETMLAIEDKARLLDEVGRLLRPGRCFGLTLEAGDPLSDAERRRTPAGNLVWLIPEVELMALAIAAGFRVRRIDDHSTAHATVARRLAGGLRARRAAIGAEVGVEVCNELIAAHEHWAAWLSSGRVRKLTIVLERDG